MTATVPFDLCGPLPGPGTTVIEASAGTGKTFTLTGLVARFVADGVDLSKLLAVTFTRAATGELRERVRSRLVATAAGMGAALAGAEPGDPLVAHLTAAPREVVEARLQRLDDAVAGFDAATIATTHGFCQLVLDGLGTAGDVVTGTALLEDPSDLVEEVLDDLYLRQALRHGGSPGFSRSQARPAVLRAVGDVDLTVRPHGARSAAGRLGTLAKFTRDEVGARLRRADQVTYDQLLARLRDTLRHPTRGEVACRRLRERWSVVLVDEFQDTDPVQWDIVRTAFCGSAATVVLVGDPKQAIYSFRGADVHAYLAASQAADHRFALGVNWRSDQPLLDGLAALFDPLQLGHPDITFTPVRASDGRQAAGVRGGPVGAPVRFRLVTSATPGTSFTKTGLLEKASLETAIAADVAADVAGLLLAGTKVVEPGGPEGGRPLAPPDVAVLTRTNRQAVAVRDALRAAKVPAVITGLDSVFLTRAATEWLRLLDGLQEPSSRGAAVGVALGPWLGWSPARAAAAGEAAWDAVHATLHRWAAVLAAGGVASLLQVVTVDEQLPARVLATEGGERLLTDLGHVAQLLHAESVRSPSGRMSVAALRAWLGARCAAGDELADADERSRRLDSDADAVQVCTVHAAKGLEWGVVYCPYLWDPGRDTKANEPVVWHDAGGRSLDVGIYDQAGDELDVGRAARKAGLAEQRGEDLRLLYVALTRAKHQVVCWWGRGHRSGESPLGRLLRARDPVTGAVGPGKGDPSDTAVRSALEHLAAGAGGLIVVDDATGAVPGDAPAAGPGEADPVPLESAAFTRRLDDQWRRASYTSITAAAHDVWPSPVRSEPEVPGPGDEPADPSTDDVAAPDPVTVADVAAVPSPWAGLPAGAEVGTTVHRVFERVDFAAADLPAAVAAAVAAVPGAGALGVPGELPAALEAVITTPLGPVLDGRALRDVARGDRLDELSFELPVAGGDAPVGAVTTSAIAALLADHLEPGGTLDGYADRLADPVLATTFRGFLTGSLDLVVRHRPPGGGERWVIADYKTNRVVPAGRPLSSDDLRPEALDAEMQRHHYPLQALLYSVALHRYLGWRLPGYAPDRHLGGVAYLFVRGMAGPATPVVDGVPCGVFWWTPPPALVVGLDDLLRHGARP